MTVQETIDATVKGNKIVLYMKGSADFPQCGFSARSVAILRHLDIEFTAVDVLADPNVRQGIKDYASWPTVPQLYIDGEFVGGSDIMMQMFESGDLERLIRPENA